MARNTSRKSRSRAPDKPYRVGRSRTGLGLFATATIAKGAFIIAYRGRRISHPQAERLEARGAKYVFEIDGRWSIDGSSRRNIMRYANHSCRPNAESALANGKIIILRAIKDIAPGDEITYDYGEEYFELFIKPVGCKCVKCADAPRKIRNKPARMRWSSVQRSGIDRSGRP
jgi:SET domain-containing protein